MSAATVTVFVVFGPGVTFSQASGTTAAVEQHCRSFTYQQDAEAEWEKWGPNDPWRWDPDGDGVVCESKPSRPGAATTGPDTPVSSKPGSGDEALPAGGSTGLGTAPSEPTTAAPGYGAEAAPGASEAPSATETPWDGTHHWSSGEGGEGGEGSWEDSPRPVGGVQAGGGGLAGDDDGTPVLPLAGVAVGALLLTAGANNRRRRSA